MDYVVSMNMVPNKWRIYSSIELYLSTFISTTKYQLVDKFLKI